MDDIDIEGPQLYHVCMYIYIYYIHYWTSSSCTEHPKIQRTSSIAPVPVVRWLRGLQLLIPLGSIDVPSA